ncbi:hypothetical protein Syun_026911 [Stephania yunnanensis]|uniref:Uncharacterized protein n=1 Tax=Stephania yunnanensis TaxID=152371 RepID=A0AAP0EGW5_9MAGN
MIRLGSLFAWNGGACHFKYVYVHDLIDTGTRPVTERYVYGQLVFFFLGMYYISS